LDEKFRLSIVEDGLGRLTKTLGIDIALIPRRQNRKRELEK